METVIDRIEREILEIYPPAAIARGLALAMYGGAFDALASYATVARALPRALEAPDIAPAEGRAGREKRKRGRRGGRRDRRRGKAAESSGETAPELRPEAKPKGPRTLRFRAEEWPPLPQAPR